MRRLFDQDFSTRLLALFLAIVIWFVVAADTGSRSARTPRTAPAQPQVEIQIERIMDAPIELRGVGQGFVAVPERGFVVLTVRGSRARVREAAQKVKAYVSLAGLAEGRHILHVEAEAPVGLLVEGIDPPEIVAELQRMVTKTIPVTIAMFEFPGGGFLVSEPVAEPSQATVTGPSGQVEKVRSVVAGVDLGGKVGTAFEQVVEPRAMDASGVPVEGVTVQPPAVKVRAEIAYLPVVPPGGFESESGSEPGPKPESEPKSKSEPRY